MIGFIIIRHVNSNKTNFLWKECYYSIRKYYSNKIIIIDDNSDTNFLTSIDNLVNCEIIQSEFPKRAELLPYYYFLKNAWFDTAVIFHDSIFIQKPIKFDKVNCFLWHFETHAYDDIDGEMNIISKLNNSEELLKLYLNKEKWYGCFGVMSVITYNMIHDINSKYNFFNTINYIRSRSDRMILERVFAVILWYEASLTKATCSYFGNIQTYCKWSFREEYIFQHYLEDKQSGNINLPIVKLWSGR